MTSFSLASASVRSVSILLAFHHEIKSNSFYYRYHIGKITHEKYFEWKLQWSFGSTITHSSSLPADIEALFQNSDDE